MQHHFSRNSAYINKFYLIIAAFYLFPMLLYSAYALQTMDTGIAWGVVTVGLLLSTFGAAAIVIMLRNWESLMRTQVATLVEKKVTQLAVPVQTQAAASEPDHRLTQEIEVLRVELQQRKEELNLVKQQQANLDTQSKDREEIAKTSIEEAKYNQQALGDLKQTISEQRTIIDKKQQYISRLETKIQDLTYEVKTLLQLGDMGANEEGRASHPAVDLFSQNEGQNPELDEMVQQLPVSSDRTVHTHYDAAVQLQKCVEIAQQLTGAGHLAGDSGRFLDLSVDSYAIDLRRLFDSYRNENTCTILLYSQKERKLLFVNNQIKGLLGWSPERFVTDFPGVISHNAAQWDEAIQQIHENKEAQIRLLAKGRDGNDAPLHCYMGKIPNGAFTNHIIGILYPA
jgi:hypothetical protein